MLNSADGRAKGGNGGNGDGSGETVNTISGKDGGIVVFSEPTNTTFTLNIYLSGNRTVQGNNYNCNGFVIAPGGGGSGSGRTNLTVGFNGGDGGSGGAGRPFGIGGNGGSGDGVTVGRVGGNGTLNSGGENPLGDGGDGGDSATNGFLGSVNDGPTTQFGNAGKAVEFTTGTTVNIYGDSTGGVPSNNRFKQGTAATGGTPNFID